MAQERLTVIRQSDDGYQTLGTLQLWRGNDLLYECKTLELPWAGNKRGKSCIPPGRYDCRKVLGTQKIPYRHIWIQNVQGRDGIKIHTGNYKRQIEGCILVGLAYGDLDKDGRKDIINSRRAFDKLMILTPDEFVLTIEEVE